MRGVTIGDCSRSPLLDIDLSYLFSDFRIVYVYRIVFVINFCLSKRFLE